MCCIHRLNPPPEADMQAELWTAVTLHDAPRPKSHIPCQFAAGQLRFFPNNLTIREFGVMIPRIEGLVL
jgi:hypothetical protein